MMRPQAPLRAQQPIGRQPRPSSDSRSQPGGGGARRQNCSGAGACELRHDRPIVLEGEKLRGITGHGRLLTRLGDVGRRAYRRRPDPLAEECGKRARRACRGCACSRCPRSTTTTRSRRSGRGRACTHGASHRGRDSPSRTARSPASARVRRARGTSASTSTSGATGVSPACRCAPRTRGGRASRRAGRARRRPRAADLHHVVTGRESPTAHPTCASGSSDMRTGCRRTPSSRPHRDAPP